MKYAGAVLDLLGVQNMVYLHDLRNFPPDCRYHDRLFSGDAVANYLWAWELFEKEKKFTLVISPFNALFLA